MGYEINWHVTAGDPILKHPLYQRYSNIKITSIIIPQLQGDLGECLCSNEAAPIISYLSFLIRAFKLTQ